MLWGVIIPLLVYWLIFFVTCYVLVEWSQNYLYDEAASNIPVRAAIGALIFAALVVLLGSRFNTILVDSVGRYVVIAIAWAAVFTLLFRYNPVHGFAIGLVAGLILTTLATLAVDSLTRPTPVGGAAARPRSEPLRRRAIGPTMKQAESAETSEEAQAAP